MTRSRLARALVAATLAVTTVVLVPAAAQAAARTFDTETMGQAPARG